MNNRRKLVIAIGVGVAAPLCAFAQQQGSVRRVGFLAHRHMNFLDSDYQYGPFLQGMFEHGYVERKNVNIQWRSADGDADRLPGLAAELVKLKMDVIVSGGTPATLAAQKTTASIPIVMVGVADPIGSGLIKTLARPGGNITGATNINVAIGPKQMESLFALVPNASRVAVLINPSNLSHAAYLKGCQDGARRLGIKEVLPANAQTPQEIENAFAMMAREKAEALIVSRDGFINQQVGQISDLAAKIRLPAIGGLQEYVEAGGLISYGPRIADQYRRAAYYVARILKGAKPADLPVEQPMTFDLAVNMKTAKALGIKIPDSILVQATKVIE